MSDTDIIKIFKCLSDKSRLQIIKSLGKEDMYVERLAERLGLSPPTVSFHLKKLEGIGAVQSRKEQYYVMYSLCKSALSFTVLDLILDVAADTTLQDQRDNAYRQKVIKTFMEYGKLKSIPTQLKKKLIILEEICNAFEPGKAYTEREVNIIIADFHDDFCTIRRDMVGAGLLQRENGVYTKTPQA